MKNTAVKILRCATLLAILLAFLRPLSSQQGQVYQKFQPTPEYLEAHDLLENPGSRALGVDKLLALGRANPRTTLGGKCMFDAAYYCENSTLAHEIYEEVARDYPGSVFELVARRSLLTLDVPEGPPYIEALNSLFVAMGAPSTRDIEKHPTASLRRLQSFSPELRQGFASSYRKIYFQLMGLKRYREALDLAIFGREAYISTSDGMGFRANISSAFLELTKRSWWRGQPIPLQLHVLNPRPGDRVCGRPLLVVEAWSGDFFQPTIDLDTSDVTLDGQDIRSKLLVTLKYPKELKQGEVFEKMKFTYQPPNPLAPGRHTLRVRLETPFFKETGIGQSEVTREFFVDRHIGDDRDDDDENDNERRRERDDD